MEPINDPITQLLTEVVLPSLQAVHADQGQQIDALRRVERSIEALRQHLDTQFVQMKSQLTVCRAELAATQAMLRAAGISGSQPELAMAAVLH